MSSCRIRVASTVVAVDMLAAATARTNSWSSLFVGCTHRQPENRVVEKNWLLWRTTASARLRTVQ